MGDLDVLTGLLGSIEVGDGIKEGPLTLSPVFGCEPSPEYLVGRDAFDLGVLAVEEHAGGVVPDIAAINVSELPVLLLDGEHLRGARQDRIMNVSALLAPNSKTLLPVSCVERGRWHYEQQQAFSPSPDHSYARLRRVQAEATVTAAKAGAKRRSHQGAVWDEVSIKHLEAGVHSPSGAMRDAYAGQTALLERISRRFPQPAAGQTGVLAVVGGLPIAMDLFDKPATLYKMWPRLVRSYAMDALGSGTEETPPGVIEEFVASARLSEWSTHPAVALGTDLVVESNLLVGSGLAWAGGIPHLALFARERATRRSDGRRTSRRHFHQ